MGNNDSSVETFLQWIKASDNIVFFGGAGVSTESGIPDFRSVDGLYNQKYDYPPETILSHTFYRKHPQEFYRFYRDKMLCLDAEPNITHYKLAELEKAGKLKGVVTQNIDGLHQKAGSKNVMELHGSVLRNYCERCLQFVSAEEILNSTGVPKCPKCGGPVKPDVVLYEEGLNQKTLEDAIYYISHADVLIVGGTSLAVYSAADISSSSSEGSETDILINHPLPYTSSFTSSGLSSNSAFASITSPLTGMNRSETVFTASIVPKTSSLATTSPSVVMSTKTISPSSP